MNWKFWQSSTDNKLKIKIKRLYPDAVIPTYAKEGDAGLDLTAHSVNDLESEPFAEYGTGIAVEIPIGYVGFVFPRSSVSKKRNFYLKNAVGVIDSGYRGEIKMRFHTENGIVKRFLAAYNEGHDSNEKYKIGEKIGQLIILPYPLIEFEEVSELSSTERDVGGFGSTGN